MSTDKLSRENIVEHLAGIELLSLDTDGVLTDGGIYFNDAGEEIRKFNVKDGMGIKLAQAKGVKVVIITSSSTPSIGHRAAALGVDHVYLGVSDKREKLTELCTDLGLSFDQVVHMGDDLNDIPVMEMVGCPISVADAVQDTIATALFVTDKKGGDGAVREVCDLIVSAKNAGR